MTTTAPSVPQVLLPGQAAAPEGPVDMIMMYVMHHAFRRDLAAFAARVPTVAVDDAVTWRALAQRWTDFASVLHKHHSGEDAGLWPLLLERVDAAGDATDGRRSRRWRPSTPRSTRCSRRAPAGSPGWPMAAPPTTGPRSPCGRPRPGTASAGTWPTRRPRRWCCSSDT